MCSPGQTHTWRTQGPELSIGCHTRLHPFLGNGTPSFSIKKHLPGHIWSCTHLFQSLSCNWATACVSSPLSSTADKSPVYSGNSYYSLNSWLCILHYWISSHFYYSSLRGHPVLSVWHVSQVCVISRLQPHAMFCAKVIHENIKWDPSSRRILEELRSYTQPDTFPFNTTSCCHSVSSLSILTALVLISSLCDKHVNGTKSNDLLMSS